MRRTNRLSALGVRAETSPGYHSDGAGLYLQVGPLGSKSWIYRYRLAGRSREMGLGSITVVPLAQARLEAQICRKLLHDKLDPLDHRRAAEQAALNSAAKTMTFCECAKTYVAAQRGGWRNAKHADQWTATLTTYAGPVLGDLPIQSIDTELVMKVIEPIWRTKTETAGRLRGRIEAILDWATVRRYRSGDNPARWRGHLEHLLPAPGKIKKVVHHPALSYVLMPIFLHQLRKQAGMAARGLEFQILTAARTGEVIGARWEEFDMDYALWTVPAERMKAAREHRAPLSARVLDILSERRANSTSDFVFPGMRPHRPLSNMAFLQLLKRMGHADLTAHGFRSTFRDWAAEQTDYANQVVEMALAHSIGDKVEAAYRRGDLLDKRRALMKDWALFGEQQPHHVGSR